MRPGSRLPLALLLSLATLACSSDSKGAAVTGGTPGSEGGGRSGAELYAAYCTMCHGAKGEGSSMGLGPGYSGIAQYWDAEKLSEYLLDPQAYAANVERLGKRPMTALPSGVTPDERERLVEHTLSLMD